MSESHLTHKGKGGSKIIFNLKFTVISGDFVLKSLQTSIGVEEVILQNLELIACCISRFSLLKTSYNT